MDLYQIFITHNRAWSAREMIFFSVLLTAAVAVACYLVRRQKILKSQAAAGMLLLVFLVMVFGSTVFTRNPSMIREYELELFWSWKAAFQGSREMLTEILLNLILLFPAGVLLPFVFYRRVKWWESLLAGLVISVVIETSQLVLCRGLFEWDDMLHNAAGCMAGALLCGWVKEKSEARIKKKR